jgi:outer membrane receptor protein involved in Fe transport
LTRPGSRAATGRFTKVSRKSSLRYAPALTWYPNDQTRFTLLTSYQKDPDAGYRNFLPAYGTVKSANGQYIPRDFNVSDPNYDQSWREQTLIGYELEHQFADNLTFRQNARYATIKQKYRYLVYANSAANSTLLTRRAQHEERTTNEFGLDNQLEYLANTGEVSHTLLGGFDYKGSKDKQLLERGSGSQYDLDWTRPVYGVNVDESTFSTATDEQQNLDQMGLYLQDQMSWNRWEWLVSGRYDWSEVRTNDFTDGSLTQQNDSKFTWLLSAGIVVVILMSPVWLQKQYGFAPAVTLQANSIATIMLCFGCLIAGLAVDRFGSSITFIIGSLLLAGASWAFYHLAGAHPEQLFLLYGVVGLCVGVVGAVPYVMVRW